LALLFPAATTTVMPSATALATAVFNDELAPAPTLRFATAGTPARWLVMAQFKPEIRPETEPEPVQPRTRIGTMDADFATPYFVPAMIPET
jgi:hypothetical protein